MKRANIHSLLNRGNQQKSSSLKLIAAERPEGAAGSGALQGIEDLMVFVRHPLMSWA
jgi:hypothetical protein